MTHPDFQIKPGLTLMQRVEQAFLYYGYAERTRLSYSRWIRSYVHYLKGRNVEGGRYQSEIPLFLDYLEADKKMAESSRIQARNAIVFLFERVFGLDVEAGAHSSKIRKTPELPMVMTRAEVRGVLVHMRGRHLLMASLMYGAGLRLMECVRLRICQLDMKRGKILILPPEKGRERETLMPECLKDQLACQIDKTAEMHRLDSAMGGGRTVMTQREQKRYHLTDNDFEVQYLFPAGKMIHHEQTGVPVRPCVTESGVQKAFRTALKRAGIKKKVSCSTLRHCFALHLLEDNVSIYEIQRLMGHADIRSTQVYLELMQAEKREIKSPLDR